MTRPTSQSPTTATLDLRRPVPYSTGRHLRRIGRTGGHQRIDRGLGRLGITARPSGGRRVASKAQPCVYVYFDFDFDSAVIRSEFIASIDVHARQLLALPGSRLEARSHSAERVAQAPAPR